MAQLGALEAMRSGTTLALEDTHSVDTYADAMVGTGMRFLFGERAHDRTGTSIGDPAPFERDDRLGRRRPDTIERAFRDRKGPADGRHRKSGGEGKRGYVR